MTTLNEGEIHYAMPLNMKYVHVKTRLFDNQPTRKTSSPARASPPAPD